MQIWATLVTIAGVIKMKKAALVLAVFSAMIVLLLSNIKSTQSIPVANGSAGMLFFVFIWFVLFVIPKLEE